MKVGKKINQNSVFISVTGEIESTAVVIPSTLICQGCLSIISTKSDVCPPNTRVNSHLNGVLLLTCTGAARGRTENDKFLNG